MKRALVLACVLAWPLDLTAQQASLQGIVTSASSGSPLEGVAITLSIGGERVHGTYTDRNGFYQVGGIVAASYSLRAQLIGYEQHDEAANFAPGERKVVNLQLATRAVALQGIVVTAEKGAAVREQERQRITPADIRAVPLPAGTGDLATYIQTLPGVATTSDRGGQIYVRGGTPAENLVLVDGIPIYQPYHILGFFSVFPEDLVSSADFYAGGFGARYSGRTSSVLDVQLRDGSRNGYRGMASVSPFVAEALAEGPAGSGFTWLASARRSLIEETSSALMGTTQPLYFESQLLKVTTSDDPDRRCSVLGLHSADRGRLDPEEKTSHISWENALLGGRCVLQSRGALRLSEVNFSVSSFRNAAVSRGSSEFSSRILQVQNDAHAMTLVGAIPLYTGYHLFAQLTRYDLEEIYGVGAREGAIFGMDGYVESAVPIGKHAELRPGVVLVAAPRAGVEPRVRGSWEPFGRPSEKLQGAFGLYRQNLVSPTDMRDVTSVFTAWMSAPHDSAMEALHAILGWQQALGKGFRWSIEGYYKALSDIPVPAWRAIPQFNTRLERADGTVYGADGRIEYSRPWFYGFIGYGYGWTQYEVSQREFEAWFGNSVQHYHPPHDRRHQVNAVGNLTLGKFRASARWQLGSGLPFTRPLGFDEVFNFGGDLYDVTKLLGTSRLVLDRPFNGRLPVMHRLDLSLEQGFDLPFGRLLVQGGAINVYDRRNMFYYDLYTGRRVDQLPLAPYAALTLRPR